MTSFRFLSLWKKFKQNTLFEIKDLLRHMRRCYLKKINSQKASTLLSGGGAIHHFDVITPKLIKSKINDESPRMTPEINS